jgi:hypothetical protein
VTWGGGRGGGGETSHAVGGGGGVFFPSNVNYWLLQHTVLLRAKISLHMVVLEPS